MTDRGNITISGTLTHDIRFTIVSITGKRGTLAENHNFIVDQMRKRGHNTFWVHTIYSPTKKTTMKYAGLPPKIKRNVHSPFVLPTSPLKYIDSTYGWAMTAPRWMFLCFGKSSQGRKAL